MPLTCYNSNIRNRSGTGECVEDDGRRGGKRFDDSSLRHGPVNGTEFKYTVKKINGKSSKWWSPIAALFGSTADKSAERQLAAMQCAIE